MHRSFVRRSGLATGILVVGLLAGLFGHQGTARGAGSVIYVAPGGAGAQDGLSWANARDLQAALTAAVSGDQLWVKAGTYTPGDARSATFALKTGVAVYGGFAGMETALSARDFTTNVTTLSGEIGAAGSADNSYHVVTGSGTTTTARLDGMTISGGNANGSAPHNDGGGVYNANSSPTLTNVTIAGNAADY